MLYPAMPGLQSLVFMFHGKNSHASSAPFNGINALDAMTLFFQVTRLKSEPQPWLRAKLWSEKQCQTDNVTRPTNDATPNTPHLSFL